MNKTLQLIQEYLKQNSVDAQCLNMRSSGYLLINAPYGGVYTTINITDDLTIIIHNSWRLGVSKKISLTNPESLQQLLVIINELNKRHEPNTPTNPRLSRTT